MKTNNSFIGPVKFLIITTFILTLISSCGKKPQNQIVRDVGVETSFKDGDVWVSLSSEFDLGGLTFSSIDLPIINPKHPSEQYGHVSFLPTLGGTYNEIVVSINLTKTAQVNGSDAPTLPNGSSLPIGGLDDATALVELEIAEIKSKIYFAIDHDSTMLGFAITIKEFDSFSGNLGGSNLFLGFNIENVRGMVGMFTSMEPEQSGLGFFVDLSDVLNGDIINDAINDHYIDSKMLSISNKSLAISKGKSFSKRFQTNYLSRKKKSSIYKGFRNISRKTSKLRLKKR